MVCYLLDEEIEKRLLSVRAKGGGRSSFSQQETSEMLYGMGREFSDYWGFPTLFLATTADVALLVEDIIEKDFPEVFVLHRQVVAEPASMQPTGRVPGWKAKSAT